MAEHNVRQLAKNTGYLYLRMIFVMLISLFTSRIILQTLGFVDFGIYNVVGSVVVFLSFLQAALRNATSRYLTYDIGIGNVENIHRTFSMAVNVHIVLAILMFALLEIGGVWFINNKLNVAADRLYAANWAFQFSLLTFCISIVRTPYESNIIAHERMDFYALTSIVEVVLKLAIVYLLLIVNFDKLIVYSILLAIIAFLLLLWYIVYCSRKLEDTKYKAIWDRSMIVKFTKYSGWSMLVNGACIARSQSINIFFNLFLGVLANAAMGVANQVVSALNMFVTNFTQAFRPQILKSWAAKDYVYFHKLIFMTSKISYLLLLMLSLPLMCNLDFALKLWLGDYPPMAIVFVQTIILYYLVDALQDPLVTAVHATGQLRFHQIMIASIVFLVIPIAYIMLKLGCSGASVLIVNALSNIVCAIGRTIYMKRLIKLDLHKYMRDVILPVAIITLLSVPIPIYISLHIEKGWLNLLSTSFVAVTIIIVLTYFLGLNTSEKRQLEMLPVVGKLFKEKRK